jgi:hypothetical protein
MFYEKNKMYTTQSMVIIPFIKEIYMYNFVILSVVKEA